MHATPHIEARPKFYLSNSTFRLRKYIVLVCLCSSTISFIFNNNNKTYISLFHSILTAFTICTADGIILRKDCLQFANFTYQKQNAVLQGYVIATFTNKSPSQCEAECINEYRCKSINTETAGSKTCELNNATQADKIDNVTVSSRTGWTFKSTNYTELLVSVNMIESVVLVSLIFLP